MKCCIFEKVIVIGYGQIVNNCIKKLCEIRDCFGYELLYIEYENTSLSTSTELCEKLGVDFDRINDKSKVTETLIDLSRKTLIISAGNFYIFPKEVVRKENLTIINFHSALLPKYPGRNAQSWAIFCDEEEAGATWHFVTEELDAGKSIIQKSCRILEDTKAYELTGNIMSIAYEAFCEIIEDVLCNEYVKVSDLKIPADRRVYKGKDVPGDGHFELSDTAEYIYRLLRATDYGKSDIFPAITTYVDGTEVRVSSYKKIKNDGINKLKYDEKAIFIPFDEEYVLRIKYKVVNE